MQEIQCADSVGRRRDKGYPCGHLYKMCECEVSGSFEIHKQERHNFSHFFLPAY